MDARPWQSSANRYYAFGGEKLDLLHRISKTPPPPSTHSSRSPPATYNQQSAPTSPMFGSSTLLKSSLLDRISPKGYSPHSRSVGDVSPLSPKLGDCLDSHLDKEEEEQVIRVLDNNQELVYQRDFGADERQDRDGELHESRNSSPVKKRKLVHANQSTSTSSPQSSPGQNKSNQKVKHTRSHSHSPPHSQPNASSPSKKQPLASRLGIDWSSGSPSGSGSPFGKRSGLTFGFAGYGYDTSAIVNTTGKATLQDRIEAIPAPEPSQDDLQDNTHNSCRLEHRIDMREPTPPSTAVIARDQNNQIREPSVEKGNFLGGTSLLRRIGSHRPISDPELEAPLEGGEYYRLDHEADHEGGEMIEYDASPPTAPPPASPSRLEDIRMDSPPLPESPPRTPNHEDLPVDAAKTESVTSSRPLTSRPESGTPSQAEVAEEEFKSMEQHAEDLLQDIQKEFLSRTEVRVSPPSAELNRITPGLPRDASMSLRDHDEHPRISPAPVLGGISPLVGARSISPFLDIDHHYITADAMSIYTHTPRSTAENLPASIARSTSFPTSDLDSNDTLLEVDPELDQITKQALGDLIVHSLKLNHDLDANEGWENSDVVRRAIKQEVDEHARDFLRLAAKLARRMDFMTEPHQSTEVSDVEPGQPMAESILPDTAENGYLEHLSPLEGVEGNEEPPPCEEDTQHAGSDVEMDFVPPEVPHSDPGEDRTELNDEPTGEKELDYEPAAEHVERVDNVESADEGDSEEPGLEIPGVWCARTGKDRTDTIQEHIEVSEVLAARVKKWAKKNGGSEAEPGHGPVVMNLMCLQTSVMQELYASFEDGARPVEDFFTSLKALKCTWPTGGKLMVQVRAGEPERTKTWFSHQLVQGKPLDISSVIHPGRVTLQFVQLADLSNYAFLLLVSEPDVVTLPPLRKVVGTGDVSGAESKSKVDEYLSRLEFPSTSP
ncbi:hypothetical protein BDM02DRAFT_3115020 [Thelephora ganbajun]|uniref:Uncharacterized protein n=1 Tax=Thelephora ganbajun TaxID=370292 RepID=A0ACB6ZGB9_THEGA|nr:hypothetical protein BDM02DRAFT_3115020 [Thelephora ganbajun]